MTSLTVDRTPEPSDRCVALTLIVLVAAAYVKVICVFFLPFVRDVFSSWKSLSLERSLLAVTGCIELSK